MNFFTFLFSGLRLNRSKRAALRAAWRVQVLTLALVSMSASAAIELLDRVAVIVDNDILMESQVQQRITTVKQNVAGKGMDMPLDDQLREQVLERMIVESLQLQMGERAGVRISDAQLNESLSGVAKQNGMNLTQFRKAVNEDGGSYLQFRESIRKEMIIKRVQQGNVNNRVQITEQEVESFLASKEGQLMSSPDYRVGHFAIELNESATESEQAAALKIAEELVSQLQAGKPFESIVALKEYRGYVTQGGDLGWRKKDDLPSIFTEAVPKLAIGAVSEPILTEGSIHILKLLQRRGGETRMVEQTKARHILLKTSEILTSEQAQAKLQTMVEAIRKGDSEFAELAIEHSDDIGSAREGGDLGWTMPGQMVPEFETAMAVTAVDEISDPFQSQFGWHVLMVEGRKSEDFSDQVVRNQASNYIYQRKFDEELESWLQKIRDEAYVDIK